MRFFIITLHAIHLFLYVFLYMLCLCTENGFLDYQQTRPQKPYLCSQKFLSAASFQSSLHELGIPEKRQSSKVILSLLCPDLGCEFDKPEIDLQNLES